MRKTPLQAAAVAAPALLLLAACATGPSPAELDAQAKAMMLSSFSDKGIAKVERLNQDEANEACSQADASGKPLAPERARAIEAANLKTIVWPQDGKFLGDWKEGEKIAQSGRGNTWTDKAGEANGGNCYNCHQIGKSELSYGTLGPSLYQYGKLRGVSDPADPASKAIVEYTWGKLWNAKAYNACSAMPRAGHAGILTPQQIQHVMALLLDPKSPVNQ